MSCFGSRKQSNASTLDRRQMKIYSNVTNQTTFILFVFLSSSFWNCITKGSHSYYCNAVSDQMPTSVSCFASSKPDPPPSSISTEKNPRKYGSSLEHICVVLSSLTLATQFVFCDNTWYLMTVSLSNLLFLPLSITCSTSVRPNCSVTYSERTGESDCSPTQTSLQGNPIN